MLNLVHVSAAAAIVTVIPNPWLSLPLAFASHLILDTVPHWNWHPGGTPLKIVASFSDIILAALLSLLFTLRLDATTTQLTMLAACFLSTVPDLIQGPYYFLHWHPKPLVAFIKWESARQKWPWMTQFVGLSTQLITLVISLWIVFTYT